MGPGRPSKCGGASPPHILEGLPGPPGSARPQKRTTQNSARLLPGTQLAINKRSWSWTRPALHWRWRHGGDEAGFRRGGPALRRTWGAPTLYPPLGAKTDQKPTKTSQKRPKISAKPSKNLPPFRQNRPKPFYIFDSGPKPTKNQPKTIEIRPNPKIFDSGRICPLWGRIYPTPQPEA